MTRHKSSQNGRQNDGQNTAKKQAKIRQKLGKKQTKGRQNNRQKAGRKAKSVITKWQQFLEFQAFKNQKNPRQMTIEMVHQLVIKQAENNVIYLL